MVYKLVLLLIQHTQYQHNLYHLKKPQNKGRLKHTLTVHSGPALQLLDGYNASLPETVFLKLRSTPRPRWGRMLTARWVFLPINLNRVKCYQAASLGPQYEISGYQTVLADDAEVTPLTLWRSEYFSPAEVWSIKPKFQHISGAKKEWHGFYALKAVHFFFPDWEYNHPLSALPTHISCS